MIDLMENKVLGPLIQQKYDQGLEKGLERGERHGQQQLLLELLNEKFGPLPDWAETRLQSASNVELHAWAKRILRSSSLEDTLA